jgi:hypothetical protein
MLPIGRLDRRTDRSGPHSASHTLYYPALLVSPLLHAAPFSSARLLAVAFSSAAASYPLPSRAAPRSSPHSALHGEAARPTLLRRDRHPPRRTSSPPLSPAAPCHAPSSAVPRLDDQERGPSLAGPRPGAGHWLVGIGCFPALCCVVRRVRPACYKSLFQVFQILQKYVASVVY